ncbi:hypothetical protein [Streptomyces sp. NBC_01669]|uniref:hypothetical protein n=1 Tax=unclassified Streptomyces TaxID=2593676 RepID=UPI0022530147|nr:hypothetical protein [Streptomyces sp. NBC_01669]MCX4534862.1 hypothetical protein [Streptomyces sp. NBC_01669]
MTTPELEERLAALEKSQERMASDLARLESAVRDLRRPSFWFVVRVAIGLIVLWVALQFVPMVALMLGSAIFNQGGRPAIGAIALIVIVAVAVTVTVKAVRNRRASASR